MFSFCTNQVQKSGLTLKDFIEYVSIFGGLTVERLADLVLKLLLIPLIGCHRTTLRVSSLELFGRMDAGEGLLCKAAVCMKSYKFSDIDPEVRKLHTKNSPPLLATSLMLLHPLRQIPF